MTGMLRGLLCGLMMAGALTSAGRGEDAADVRRSVVKVITTVRKPELFRPWTRQGAEDSGGTGFIIEGNRILTNYHVIGYTSQIYVQPYQSSERYSATVEVFSPTMDLAVLKLDDESIFKDHPPLPIDDSAGRPKSAVNVYGYPIGGDQLSITEGIISRIEFVEYYYDAAGLQIQIDAAINPGNSGGPAIADGKVVGVAFRGISSADNIGYLIAAEEVRSFLEDVRDGKYDGKPLLADEYEWTDNDALRDSLKLPKDLSGCLITRLGTRDEAYPLRVGDVVTHIGPHAVDRRGQAKRGEDSRVFFTYYVPMLASEGKVPLTVFRDGASLPLEVPTSTTRERVTPYLKGDYPDYFIVGPLAFSTASGEMCVQLLQERRWVGFLARLRSPLLTRALDVSRFEGEQMVVLAAPVFSHRISKGYTDHKLLVLDRLNGTPVKNLAHAVELVRDSKDEFLEFTFAEQAATRFVFRRQELLDATEEILVDNGIRNQCSPELVPVWEKE